jgi:hypothetical protein
MSAEKGAVGLALRGNMQSCIESVLANNIPGDIIETAAWRGGGTRARPRAAIVSATPPEPPLSAAIIAISLSATTPGAYRDSLHFGAARHAPCGKAVPCQCVTRLARKLLTVSGHPVEFRNQ